MNFKQLCQDLEAQIQDSYVSGVSLEDAEKLAGKFLHAQMIVSEELKKADLDARMKKTGVKAVRGAVYADIVGRTEKKPTEAQIDSELSRNAVVQAEQDKLDKAEVDKDELTRCYQIFREAHIHYRGLAKGRFDG